MPFYTLDLISKGCIYKYFYANYKDEYKSYSNKYTNMFDV